jgi:3-oxoacyl-[acyl-carrier protein] reductase
MRKALVTGGSRGIGRAISISLAKAGMFVYVNYTSNAEAAEVTVNECKAVGGDAVSIKFNVGNPDEVTSAFEQMDGLSVLVNNAGITSDGLAMRLKDSDWEKTINVNLSGAFYCARAAMRSMMKAKYGRIINISSVVGEMGNAGQAAYVASKAGLIGLTKSLAKELGSRNITVNALTPGFIKTDMTSELSDEMKQTLLSQIPLGRFAEPEEVASACVFLASDQASYITGQVLGVNGGLYM